MAQASYRQACSGSKARGLRLALEEGSLLLLSGCTSVRCKHTALSLGESYQDTAQSVKNLSSGTSLVVQRLRLPSPNAGGLGSIPGQGTRPHMLQLKILHATGKTEDSPYSPINKNLKKRKNLSAKQETCVQFLDQEDPLEKEMATIPVVLPGESHGQRSLACSSPWGHKSWTRLGN